MKKILALTAALLFISNLTFAQQLWAEYQNNWKHYQKDSLGITTHTLQAFYSGKGNKAGFSINLFALATKGWGELSIQPTFTEKIKGGVFSLSMGAGIETGTKSPRLMSSVFFLKNNTEFLFYWEQGTDVSTNNWHLCYLMQKVVQHEEGLYVSFGLHAQKYAVYGFRSEIGLKDKFTLYIVLGKPTFKERSLAALMGLRYFLQ